MSTVNGLPAHILFNHFVVVLGPLTAILAILCALWPAARRRLIWLVLVLAAATVVLDAADHQLGNVVPREGRYSSPVIDSHQELGETLIYMVVALTAAWRCWPRCTFARRAGER